MGHNQKSAPTTNNAEEMLGNGKPPQTRKDGISRGVVGFIGSLLVAFFLAFFFVCFLLGGLGGSEGGEYAGLAAIFVGGLIFLGTIVGLGLLLLIFYFANGWKKALIVAVIQIVLAGLMLVLYLSYIAS